MSNVAIIFAGGTGNRMNTKSKPKQFLELHGKPILIYTLEVFDNHPEIDGIILVILESWIGYCEDLISKFGLKKVRAVIAGGDSALSSQRNGLLKAAELFEPDSVVLIHDGVRPLIDEDTISRSINAIMTCDMLIIVGTSLRVYPAAGFIRYFKGRYVVVINKDNTSYDSNCDLVFNEDVINVIKNIK